MRTECALICAAVVAAAGGRCFAFDASGRAKIAADAIRLAPPALGRQLQRHRGELARGAQADPLPQTLDEARQRLARQTDALVVMIDTHRPFRVISEAFGRLAGTIATLNHPLWGRSDQGSLEDAARFSAFFEDRMDRFPLVFDG